jgi:hypothetical protein
MLDHGQLLPDRVERLGVRLRHSLRESRLPAQGDIVDSSGDQKSHRPAQVVAEIVRYLASRPGIGPGSRILLCGVSNAVLIQGLTDLGLLVTCMDEEDAESLQEMIPEADCCEGNVPREQFDQADQRFDLVVVPAALKSDCSSVFSRTCMMELAGRLACVRPGGILVQLGGIRATDSAGTPHSRQCCLRQVSMFPGRSLIRSFAGQRRLRFSRRVGQFAVSLKLPEKRMSPFEWDILALHASRRLPTDCCQTLFDRGEADLKRVA